MSKDQQASEAFYLNVGERLRAQRKNAGMDQETLSRHLGLSRTTVINIEKGRQKISLEQTWLAAQVLEISIVDLLPPASARSVDELLTMAETGERVDVKELNSVKEWISKARTKKSKLT